MGKKHIRCRNFFGTCSCVQVCDNELVHISRCIRISEYDDDHLIADTGMMEIEILGKGISADDNNTEGLTVHGCVLQINFREKNTGGE